MRYDFAVNPPSIAKEVYEYLVGLSLHILGKIFKRGVEIVCHIKDLIFASSKFPLLGGHFQGRLCGSCKVVQNPLTLFREELLQNLDDLLFGDF